MKCVSEHMRLYAVTDRAWTGEMSLAGQIEAALRGGVTCVQLREKHLSEDDFLAEAIEIAALCKRYGVPFLINDNIEIALRCGADGVHVGQHDTTAAEARRRLGPDKIVGVSAHNVDEALRAAADGASYLGAGAAFATATKTDATPLSHQTLRDICVAVEIPVVAIGGIHRDNLAQLAGTGVDGVALVSAIFAAKDIEAECRALRVLSEQMVRR